MIRNESADVVMPNQTGQESTIFNLESYRSRLMSRLSRDDVINILGVIQVPEVFADPPPNFSLDNFLRKDDDSEDQAQIIAITTRYKAKH